MTLQVGTMMTLVFRIEDKNGVGPYASGLPGVNAQGCAHQPAPWRTGLGRIEPGEFSGFQSMSQLLDWFRTHEELEALERGGMRVVKMRVPEDTIRRGDKHLVFRELVSMLWTRKVVHWLEVHDQLDKKLALPTSKGE